MADPVDAAKRRLVAVCAELDAHRSGSVELQEERRVLVVGLRAAGVGRPELAKLAGCSTDLVKSLLAPPRSRKSKKASA